MREELTNITSIHDIRKGMVVSYVRGRIPVEGIVGYVKKSGVITVILDSDKYGWPITSTNKDLSEYQGLYAWNITIRGIKGKLLPEPLVSDLKFYIDKAEQDLIIDKTDITYI